MEVIVRISHTLYDLDKYGLPLLQEINTLLSTLLGDIKYIVE